MTTDETRQPTVRNESITGVTLSGCALTFNADAPPETLDDDTMMAVDAIYVMLTPNQASKLRSFLSSHGGEERDRGEYDGAGPEWLSRATPQAGAAAETAQYVADQLPEDDDRKEIAQQAADNIGAISDSLHEERNAAIEAEKAEGN